ncbi:MAG: hypothetical protein M3503_04745 [Actinomycetota bacterium]|nr:hypothetical protein [Actinomycetota bacterium]
MAKKRGAKGLSTKSRVVAEHDLVGVPEGTPGRIELVNGLTWIRYWVQFDNGVWLGSVDADAVVAEDDWEDHLDRRAAAQARAAEEAARPKAEAAPAAATADAAPADAATSRIPAALLARSQAAKAKAKKAVAAE